MIYSHDEDINNDEVLMSENEQQPHSFNSIADAEERETRNEMRVTVSSEGVAKGQGDGLEVERCGVRGGVVGGKRALEGLAGRHKADMPSESQESSKTRKVWCAPLRAKNNGSSR